MQILDGADFWVAVSSRGIFGSKVWCTGWVFSWGGLYCIPRLSLHLTTRVGDGMGWDGDGD